MRKADNLTTQIHEIWEPETSWNPLGHTGPVTGLLYLYIRIYMQCLRIRTEIRILQHMKRTGVQLNSAMTSVDCT